MIRLATVAALVTAFSLAMTACGGGGSNTNGLGGINGSSGPGPATSLAVLTAILPNGTQGVPYSQNLTAGGGTAPYTWGLATGSSLPQGVALSPLGVLAGTPANSGTFNFTALVTDNAGSAANRSLSLTVAASTGPGPGPAPLAITTTLLAAAVENSPYTAGIAATGGSGAGYLWTLATGSALPPGLTLSSGTPNATISGTATAVGTTTFTLNLTDSAAATATATLSLTVVAAGPGPGPSTLAISTLKLSGANAGTAYTATISATGGTGTGYAWAVATGSTLPAGLALTSGTPDATLSGTPATGGVYQFTVQVTDSGSVTVAKVLSLVVISSPVGATISTVGGNGQQGFAGDNGTFANARFNQPMSLTRDNAGHLYISDYDNHRIRKVDAQTGIVTTVAGNGSAAFGGDGNAATSASLKLPSDVAFDAQNNMYIADSDNHRIRRVDAATGSIFTFAGLGTMDPYGNGAYSGDGGPASACEMNRPTVVEFGPDGNLYICDLGNHRIRMIDMQTQVITSVAGNGFGAPWGAYSGDGGPAIHAGLSWPNAIAFTPVGDLIFADIGNICLRKIDMATGIITRICGDPAQPVGFSGDGGPAINATMGYCGGIECDAANNVYFADRDAKRIRRIDGITGIVTTIAGNGNLGHAGDGGLATSASFVNPMAILMDGHNALLVTDQMHQPQVQSQPTIHSHRVRRIEFP